MTDYRQHPEWRAFVAAIRERPDDDLPRMVCADWLDERGEHERAELIRLQCHPRYREPCEKPTHPLEDMPDIDVHCMTFATGREDVWPKSCEPCRLRYRALQIYHGWGKVDGVHRTDWPIHFTGATGHEVRAYDRGFVRLARGPLAVLVGGEECGQCGGKGMVTASVTNDWHPNEGYILAECSPCHGTGRTPGILRDLLRVEPVAEVEVTEVEPALAYGGLCWFHGSRSGSDVLPLGVWSRLSGWDYTPTVDAKAYYTRESALAALNRAVCDHCLEPVEVTS